MVGWCCFSVRNTDSGVGRSGSSTDMLLGLLPDQGVGTTLGHLCERTLPFDGTLGSESPVPPWARQITQSVMHLSNELGWLYFAHAGARDLTLAAA